MNAKKTAKKTTKKVVKKKAKPKVKKVTHVVIWDNWDNDPVKMLHSLDEVKKFVLETLMTDDDVVKDSIKVFEVTGTVGKINVTVEF